ncbi:phosphotransferase [Evansella cellulosilytica]|uniref:Aminoglycoside phosphotransferase n=1 Tax=Evansella cellulosilytica (strain ATCC 21833 / DSM 2522 / FERM P-1141 / JCM 9156 / N-4) TaxID=649639 RepID=E6TWC3_EVAC2|nr:phosphotransferase [Evansella cellulosilytica]ADU31079.1 aminoglycoside phosphotransferase [Evansella cellulosilytica DSM 2522]
MNKSTLNIQDVEKLLELVERLYTFNIHSYKILKVATKRFIIKLHTSHGTFILKKPRLPERRFLFFIEAQAYLSKNQVDIPSIIKTRDNSLYFQYKDEKMVIYKYIEHVTNTNLTNKQLITGIQALASFHKASLTFKPIDQNYKAYSIYDWITEYNSKIINIERFPRDIPKENRQSKSVKCINKYTAQFSTYGKKVMQLTHDLSYSHDDPKNHFPYLGHGDFTIDNLLWTKDNTFIIDLDNMSYHFPSRDFSRYLFTYYKRYQTFDTDLLHQLLSCYKQINNLSTVEEQLFLLDLIFPHQFERIMRKRLYKKMTLIELERLIFCEMKKTKYLLHLYTKTFGSENREKNRFY